MNKAVIYTRVSTEEQAREDRFSLAVQKKDCQKFAESQGYKVIKIFSDPGFSGSSSKRPGLLEMMDFIKKGNVKALFIQHTDRLARNILLHYQIINELKNNQVDLYTLSQGKLEDTPEAKMSNGVLAVMNAYHNDITSFKTKKAMKEKAKCGWFPGEAPVGYLNIKGKNDKNIIIPDPEKAPLIKEGFQMYVTGNYGAASINDILHEKGLNGKRGGKMTISKFYYILSNPFYYGQFHWDKKIYKGKHQPLISKEIYDMVQKIRNSRAARRSYERKHLFLLNGFAFCKCGRRLTAEWHIKPSQKTYSYYHCTRGRACHDSRNIPIGNLEKQVEEVFQDVNFGDIFFDKLLKKLRQYYDNYAQENQNEISIIDKKSNLITTQRNKLESLLISEVITEETYKRKSQEIENDLEILKNRKIMLSHKKSFDIGKFEELADFSRNVYKSYKKSNFEAKRNYLNFFWEKFIIEDKEIVEAIPTEPFRALQSIQKPLLKGEIVNLYQVIKT